MSLETSSDSGEFQRFEEDRQRHEVEMAEIQVALEALGPDLSKFEALVAQMIVPTFKLLPADKSFFERISPFMVEIEKRFKAEEVRWRSELERYTASSKTGSTYSVSSGGSGSSTWRDENGIVRALSGASLAKINEHRQTSALCRRWMCAMNLGLWLSPNLELKVDEMRAALAEGLEKIRVNTMLSGGTAFQLKLGGASVLGQSTATRVRLVRCPFYKDKKKFAMAVGSIAWIPSELSILDFGEAKDAKDCERMTVIRSAVISFVEFFCWAFGEEHRGGVCKEVLEVVNSQALEDSTQAHPLYVPFMLTQVLAELFNMMRSTILVDVDGKKEYVRLDNGRWIPRWRVNLERMFQIEPDTLKYFRAEFEQEFKERLEERFRAGGKRTLREETDDSEDDWPVAKMTKGEVEDDLCLNALADRVSFAGLSPCYRQKCRFSHVFKGRRQAEVTRAIETCDLRILKGGSIKTDFIAATELSGLF